MDEESPEVSKPKAPVDYDEKIVRQQELVDRLTGDYEKNPSPELEMELKRKTDALLHLKNLARPNPKSRAQAAAETAMRSALGKAYA